MAWPFTNGTVAPDFQWGPGEPVLQGSPAAITAADGWLLGAHFTNTGAALVTVRLLDGSGRELCVAALPPGSEVPYEWAFRPFDGLDIGADGDGVVGHIWGYESV